MTNKEPLNIAQQLVYVLQQLHPISNDIALFFQKHSLSYTYKKGKHLLKTGEVCKHLYFLNKGVIRGYIKDAGRDITTWITSENELVTSISSFDLQKPAIENIQALEDCELISMTYKNLQKLYDRFPEFNIVGRKVYQSYYRDAENRALIARLTNAEKKYRYFLTVHCHLANRVPLKYIASYLGINLETLSRVRKKMASVKYSAV